MRRWPLTIYDFKDYTESNNLFKFFPKVSNVPPNCPHPNLQNLLLLLIWQTYIDDVIELRILR